jgi:zinc protease
LVTPEIFKHVSLEQIEKLYRERFADAGDFTFFIVGNIEEETVKPLVEKYIGSLTDNTRKETWKDNKVNMPKGKTTREIKIPLQTAKANVMLVYNSNNKYSPKNNLMFSVLRDILRLRYTEEIREKEGGTYGVGVSGGTSRIPNNEKTLQISFDTNPEKADHLKSIVYSEIDKIIANGPTSEDLDKTVKNILKDREQSRPNNSYWMSNLMTWYQTKINNDLPKNFEDILKSMTPTDIQKFAKSFFKNPDLVDVVFKPL